MRYRLLICSVLLVAAVPGLLFAPVFGLWSLVAPIAVLLLVCYGVVELCARFGSLRPWRPVLVLVLGALGLAEVELAGTTVSGLPTAATVGGLVAGVTQSWQLTLQSTWPVRPDAELLLFVPLIVLCTAAISLELLRWPALAVLPSVAALLVSQVFVPLSGTVATVAVLGYAVVVAGLFVVSRPARGATALLLVPTVVLGVAATVVVTAVDQGRQPAITLQHNQWASAQLPLTVSPLADVAARLENPATPVFSYSSDTPVDRWRLTVLTDFNGVTWTPTDRFRRLGAQVQPSVTVPTTTHAAQLTVLPGADIGPWLPSQPMPASVAGATPLIDPTSGMLLLPTPASGPARYGLTWREAVVDPNTLATAAIDPTAVTGDLGVIPPGIDELARTATADMRPSFQAALALERYLRENYRTATGADLPTGSGWPQLREFLLDTKRGTSEQFAAAYVALARIVGIPARLAVGFRAPAGTHVVHNGDVLAWPEVAVAGVGWVPLDPTGTTSGADTPRTGLSQATEQARADLPPPTQLRDPPLPPPGPGPTVDFGRGSPWPVWPVLDGLLALLVLGAAGIPLAKAIRTMRRRQRTGTRAVVAAWSEARDLLRAHGTLVTPGMTVRDLAQAVDSKFSYPQLARKPDKASISSLTIGRLERGRPPGAVGAAPMRVEAEAGVVDGLLLLAGQVDIALWSGGGASEGTVAAAWAAVRDIRRNLAVRPFAARVRALFDPRSLLAR
jgi:transglutaminase-like putative cysteine protease